MKKEYETCILYYIEFWIMIIKYIFYLVKVIVFSLVFFELVSYLFDD